MMKKLIISFFLGVLLIAMTGCAKEQEAVMTQAETVATEATEAFQEAADWLEANGLEYLNSGHCWLACLDDKVIVLFFDGQELHIKYVTKDGSDIISEEIQADFSVETESFSFYDFSGEKIADYEWKLEDEGDLKVLTMKDDEQEMLFYELERESMEEGEALAESYLNNQKDAEDIADWTQALAGYEGVSIVDAFVEAGLEPELSNRAVFAEKFDIEGYRGTAEQNLFLLESMGGKIKG